MRYIVIKMLTDKWAKTWETYLDTCAPSEYSNQLAHPRCLIIVLTVYMKICILGYPKCTNWSFWSDCPTVQADRSLHLAHMSGGTFSDVAAQIVSTLRQYESRWIRKEKVICVILSICICSADNGQFKRNCLHLKVNISLRKHAYSNILKLLALEK